MKKLVTIGMIMMIIFAGVAMSGCSRNRQGFCYETVFVILTVSASALDRTWVPADFANEVVLSEVSVLITPATPEDRKTLFLTLENPGRRNVLRAVDALNNRSDVHRAGVSQYGEIWVPQNWFVPIIASVAFVAVVLLCIYVLVHFAILKWRKRRQAI